MGRYVQYTYLKGKSIPHQLQKKKEGKMKPISPGTERESSTALYKQGWVCNLWVAVQNENSGPSCSKAKVL